MKVKIEELSKLLKDDFPNIKENQLKKLTLKTFENLLKVIEASDERVIAIQKLGKFKKNTIEKDGEVTTRMVFSALSEKEK